MNERKQSNNSGIVQHTAKDVEAVVDANSRMTSSREIAATNDGSHVKDRTPTTPAFIIYNT